MSVAPSLVHHHFLSALYDDNATTPPSDADDVSSLDADVAPHYPPLDDKEQQPTVPLPDCKVRRNYTCPVCDFFTQNPRRFLYHLRDDHGHKLKIYECPRCLYASKHYQKLLRHSRMVHGDSNSDQKPLPVDSVFVKLEINDPDDVIEEEPSSSFKCSLCSFTTRSKPAFNRHEREEHLKTKFFRCSKCTYVTHIKARYTKHVKYHSMPMIKCDMCDFRTPYKWNLDRHCKNHNGQGAFKCSACNFTADIKQSLTVHETNHHLPPVGQAAGLGVGRRRNKVGASDTTAAEESASGEQQEAVPQVTAVPTQPAEHGTTTTTTPSKDHVDEVPAKPKAKVKITPRKPKASVIVPEYTRKKESDFIHPDDFIHHSNGKVYIKNKCKLCNFKSPWDSEMAKHERKFHSIERDLIGVKKNQRPIPNLIPIPAQLKHQRVHHIRSVEIPEPREPTMSEKDISDICRRSANSALKDFASLFSSEDVFRTSASTSKVPDLIPAFPLQIKAQRNFKNKTSMSFFDKFNEELGSRSNLICSLCGHESKCLTEQVKHQKLCGKEANRVPNIIPVHNISASRCQYCRHRCKSSADLHNHLQTCVEALKVFGDDAFSEHENELKIDEDRQSIEDELDIKPHPMENKVFVWNDIMVPMDIEVDDSNYEYTDDKNDDVASMDLSVYSQSPALSDNSENRQENNNNLNTNNNHTIHNSPVTTTEKIPTHGNDISVAQHKRVFKCPHCTFWASTASRFHVHIVGHLNKKPFECSLCSYRSNWRWDITKHIKLKSVRDQAHESAKVLMTDETGRRNYSKYNKYLTEIPLSSLQSSSETSGGSGTRPRNYDRNSSPSTSKSEKSKMPASGDLGSLLKVGNLKPPPGLKAVDKHFLEKRSASSEGKRTLFKCKKCNFRDASREILLQHVKGHYPAHFDPQDPLYQQAMVAAAAQMAAAAAAASSPSLLCPPGSPSPSSNLSNLSSSASSPSGTSAAPRDLSLRGTSPDRDDERHCRLKHNGDIRVVSTKNGQEKIEIEEQPDEPDCSDVQQVGLFKCNMCPYATDSQEDYQLHLPGHIVDSNKPLKCYFCKYWVTEEYDLVGHLKLHGVCDPYDFVKSMNSNDGDGKRFRCVYCPYVTNTKTQFNYHKQFHKDRGGQYSCSRCSYNVSKRHLLHQHLKVHGMSPNKSCEEMDEDIPDEIPLNKVKINYLESVDIPLVWVLKDGKFSKMYNCRFCPHVNSRKVNIQEHEKMHSPREQGTNPSRPNDMEHRCVECNYICKNAGVLSSHLKVHQGLYGTIHSLVDLNKSDEEQLKELCKELTSSSDDIDTSEFLQVEMEETESVLYFCKDCPARFLKETEHMIHGDFHTSHLEFACDSCSYTAENASYLMSHSKVHSAEYQERTAMLKKLHIISSNHPEPELKQVTKEDGQSVWVVHRKSEIEKKNNILASFLSKPLKTSQNIPLSGTELFQQRSEARQKQALEEIKQEIIEEDMEEVVSSSNKSSEAREFDVSVQGNPEFVYQKYIKNGRMKEKRYKCHKCPSAFEKREQYKIHLGLHGSKQRYNCEYCDYSVKYYANYVQHLKKHKFDEDAHAAMKKTDEANETNNDVIESMEVAFNATEVCDDGVVLKTSVADQQMLNITQQRKANSVSPLDDKKTYFCPYCPYVNSRRDALDNHLKRHKCVSGVRSAYACEHCDYSVPQAHFLREHAKIHFVPNRTGQVDGYVKCDNLKLTSSNLKASSDNCEEEYVIFDEKNDCSSEEKFNNNKGETELPNVQTGDLITVKEEC